MHEKIDFDKPFIQITIPMLIGIVIYYYIEINIKFIIIGLAISIISFVVFIFKNKGNNLPIYIIFFFIGLLTMYGKMEKSNLVSYIGKTVEIDGIIKESKYKEGYSSYIVETKYIKYDNKSYSTDEKILLKCYGDNVFEIGDYISVEGNLKQPKRNTNPKLFNYRLYLETNDIFTTMNIRSESIRILSNNNINKGEKLRIKFKNDVADTYDRYLSSQNSDLMKSIMLGKITYLDEYNQNKYRELGLAHLMAVSGLHIGIISTFLISLLALLGVNRIVNIIITTLFMWTYGYLIGFPPSVLRSLIMFTILFYSQMLNRRYDSINAIAFSAFILLLYNPLWIFNIGFQLSFIATLSLAILSHAIWHKLYILDRRIRNPLSSIIAVQLGITPIIIYYYNNITILSFIANLIIIPIMSISLVIGFFLFIIAHFSEFIGKFIGFILDFLLNIENYLSEGIYSFPIKVINCWSLNIAEIILYYVSLVAIFNKNLKTLFTKKINKVIVIYVIFYMSIINIFAIYNKEATVEFIDVGQGDCILISTYNKNFLIDTGGNIFGDFDIGENIVLPYLRKKGINTIDSVFISHFHDDHCKGLVPILEEIKIKSIYISYEKEENKLFCEIEDKANEKNIPIYILREGDKIYFDNIGCFLVLGPNKEIVSRNMDNENNMSMVLLLDYNDYKLLFTGDIEKDAEMEIYKNNNRKFHIDLIKVPHHGSKTSSSEEFIKLFNPQYAVIQVGKNNFGHPNEEVLKRYFDRNVNIYRTDEDGLVMVRMLNDYFSVEPYIKPKLTLSQILLDYGFYINYYLLYIVISINIINKNLYLFGRSEINELYEDNARY